MRETCYLVPFNELSEFLVSRRLWNKISHLPIVKILNQLHSVQSNQDVINDSCEKLNGTWWEVAVPLDSNSAPRCLYVADSLRDALRLKPGIPLSSWSYSLDITERYDLLEDCTEELEYIEPC